MPDNPDTSGLGGIQWKKVEPVAKGPGTAMWRIALSSPSQSPRFEKIVRYCGRLLKYFFIGTGTTTIAAVFVAKLAIDRIPGAKAHFFNLLARVISQTFPFGGSNIVGALFVGMAGLVFGFAFTCAIEWGRGGRGISSFINALKTWPSWAGGILGVMFVWLLLFWWQGINTVYQDHQTLANAPPKIQTVMVQPPKESPNEILRLKERTFALTVQIRKLAGAQLDEQLQAFWRDSAAQAPTGVLTVGTDQEKRNWRDNQARFQQERFKYYVQQYHDSYMRDAINFREELLKHLPPGTRDDKLVYAYKGGFGYQEMEKVASDLERLAGMLPGD